MSQSQPTFKSGFVAVMGRPNVGKSTLMNALIGQKVAAVSPRPQTTRQMQLGIITTESAQIIFVDTPGLHVPHHKLGQYMNQNAIEAIKDADLILLLVDAGESQPHEEDKILVSLLDEIPNHPPVILILNKIDLVDKNEFDERVKTYQKLIPDANLISIAARRGENLDKLQAEIIACLPAGDPFYPKDQITDLYEKEIAADLIRASALMHLREEVPHAIAVRIDEYKERGDHGAYIAATLFVERDSQKGIVIGKNGKMLKRIGSAARKEIESMSGRKSYLKIRVKVRKNWRNDDNALRRFGFQAK
jgi:GTP-binding protein Era